MSQVTVTDLIAIVFDFDDTLMPDATTKFLKSRSVDPGEFWSQAVKLLDYGYDQPSAYIKLILDEVGQGRKFGRLNNRTLEEFGATLDGDFFPGVPEFFEDVQAQLRQNFKNIDVEFYIVSGGLQAILDGIPTVKKYFAGVYGCKLGEDQSTGLVSHIKRSITFTEKTRYLFEINKGVPQAKSDINPFLVNEDIPQRDRRIPFKNIVFVGDGLTDIPCFSLVRNQGGQAFGVFEPANPEKTKRAIQKFLIPHRVIGMHTPNYGPEHDLGAMLRAWVATRATEIQIERKNSNVSF
jgi:phosphoserine phosphatase